MRQKTKVASEVGVGSDSVSRAFLAAGQILDFPPSNSYQPIV